MRRTDPATRLRSIAETKRKSSAKTASCTAPMRGMKRSREAKTSETGSARTAR